jgi:hypothetical protein
MSPLLILGGIALVWMYRLGSSMNPTPPSRSDNYYRTYNGQCMHIERILSDWLGQHQTIRAWTQEEVQGFRQQLLDSLPRCSP